MSYRYFSSASSLKNSSIQFLFSEHIWWDQATTLRQAGLLPDNIPFNDGSKLTSLRLPVAGVECAEMLSDEQNGKSNEMMGSAWGVGN